MSRICALSIKKIQIEDCIPKDKGLKRRGIKVYIEFLFLRRNWVPPTPSPASECVSSPLGSWGEPHSLPGEGVGGPNSDELGKDTLVLYLNYNPSTDPNIL